VPRDGAPSAGVLCCSRLCGAGSSCGAWYGEAARRVGSLEELCALKASLWGVAPARRPVGGYGCGRTWEMFGALVASLWGLAPAPHPVVEIERTWGIVDALVASLWGYAPAPSPEVVVAGC
jgi:hypothetical protein